MQEAWLQMQFWWFFTFFKATWLSENKKLIDFTIQGIIYTYFCLHTVVSGLKVQICAVLFSSAVPMLIVGTIYGYKS